ncbi:uncharacterized protein LOC123531778 [Mercenaria mercenaria]|uniref:uncharacterized protein LOC123531778 n=1 Tax=Mercenaria mercenaria TaxID=6596 RepID=UPI00234ED756|nr:uncharacterized protein LOC123531778 [Mercenaria mercenaria]
MATVAASNYTESHHKDSSQYDTDGDELSTTLTIQTGYSSEYRSHAQPLSRLSRHSIKLKSCSSFPNLLSLYHTPIREESNVEEIKKKKKEPKRERRKKEVVLRPDLEDQHEKRARQESRSVRVNTVAKEQLEKFDKYVNSMKEKVEKQREERRKYNEILQERLREQEEMEKKKLRLHRGPKHVYIHDKKYLKTLPVSKYCKATRLADDLQRKGVLRTRADVEKYWSGFANQQASGIDIFSDTVNTSVNYPHQWMSTKKPEIKVTDDDDDHLTDAVSLQQRQLPPLRKKKKRRPEI